MSKKTKDFDATALHQNNTDHARKVKDVQERFRRNQRVNGVLEQKGSVHIDTNRKGEVQ